MKLIFLFICFVKRSFNSCSYFPTVNVFPEQPYQTEELELYTVVHLVALFCHPFLSAATALLSLFFTVECHMGKIVL